MKDGYYIGLHTQVRYWLPKGGKYNELEALISHTLDINDNNAWTVNGYAKLWGWSRNKVRRFLDNIRTLNGHHKDTHKDSKRTSKGQGVLLKINNFESKEDTEWTSKGHLEGQQKDTQRTPTNKNNNKNKNKNNIKHKYGEYQNVLLTDKELTQLKEKLNGRHDEWIETFSKGIKMKAYGYTNHYLAILKWAAKSEPKEKKPWEV